MKLTELDAQFLRYEQRESGIFWPYVASLAEAQGIRFLCPLCYRTNGGPVGTHGVVCWSRSRGVPDEATPGPGRWAMVGTGYDDLTLNADPPGTMRSVQLNGGCAWHGHVTEGIAE